MSRLATPPKLPKLAHGPKSPTGFKFVPKMETIVNGPGDPPAGFINGQNSLTEWNAYWALAKVFLNPRGEDIRKPPFDGGLPDWSYQVKFQTGVSISGRSAVDFVVNYGPTTIGIRIQTERYHLFTSSSKQAYDIIQRAVLERDGLRVIDIYDTQLLGDPSGQKYVIAMKQAAGLLEWSNPLTAGTALRGSRLKVLG